MSYIYDMCPSASPASPQPPLLVSQLLAIASTQRMRILAALASEISHVSELARRLAMSRPLLYLHLNKLEQAGFVRSYMEISNDGKAHKYFQLKPFTLIVNIESIISASSASQENQEP